MIDSRDRRVDGKVITTQAVKNRARRKILVAAGMCGSCGSVPIADGKKTCHACNDKTILAGYRSAFRKAFAFVGIDYNQARQMIQRSDIAAKEKFLRLFDDNDLKPRLNPFALSQEHRDLIRDMRASGRYTIHEIATMLNVHRATVIRHSTNPKKKPAVVI